MRRITPLAASAAFSLMVAYTLPAAASSDFSTGLIAIKRATPSSRPGAGICRLFTGPRADTLGEGEFRLRIGDVNFSNEDELNVTGVFVREADGSLLLVPDHEAAEDFFEEVIRTDLGMPESELDLHELRIETEKTLDDLDDDDITCRVELRGSIIGGRSMTPLSPIALGRRFVGRLLPRTAPPIQLKYFGNGQHFVGVEEAVAASDELASSAQSTPEETTAANCPEPNLTPFPSKCGTPNCLVTFAGYQWWTEYEFFPGSGFYNMSNAWSPLNVTVDGEGLHLFVRVDDVGGGPRYTAAEAVAMRTAAGAPVDHGFGTYLVSARVKSAPSWAEMDPNVAFGVFTYERDRTGTEQNPPRELDLAEVSRWGNFTGSCTSKDRRLCQGNSQFTVQLYDRRDDNLHRYSIAPGVREITLVMDWHAANQPVTFRQYNGIFALDSLPATPANQWTTSAAQNPFIPDSRCQRFHLNLWMGAFQFEKAGYNPPPARPQEVVVTGFEYHPG